MRPLLRFHAILFFNEFLIFVEIFSTKSTCIWYGRINGTISFTRSSFYRRLRSKHILITCSSFRCIDVHYITFRWIVSFHSLRSVTWFRFKRLRNYFFLFRHQISNRSSCDSYCNGTCNKSFIWYFTLIFLNFLIACRFVCRRFLFFTLFFVRANCFRWKTSGTISTLFPSISTL